MIILYNLERASFSYDFSIFEKKPYHIEKVINNISTNFNRFAITS